MFRIILSCLSQLWAMLCRLLSFRTTSQTPPSSTDSDPMPSTTISHTPSPTVTCASTSSQTQSTFVSSSTPTEYDVFLSFRGKDTRLNFTSHLYQRLHGSGIRTFKDNPELRRGEVISETLLDAIRKSKTYIVVLSQNYATSSWCLDELVEILNCHKTAERWVIPVFYKIDPSVARHQIGSFKQAFKKHQVRFQGEREKVKNWQLALNKLASFSGHHISEDRPEAEFINEIVDELLLKINPKTLDVTRYQVGLNSRVEAITTLLSSDTKGVIRFGIYGMGGVGKTTLAKALFNQLVSGGRFKGSCFLANVRERAAKGLELLQMQLINDVLCTSIKVEVHNVDQGIKLIEARICSTKVVVVIDDLDDLKQLQSLVGPFAAESVVIITTRDEEILIKTEVETRYRYMVNTLDEADSLALFMRHAFGDDEPNSTLMKLSKYILRLAGGLPLALEVFGSYLYRRPERGWKSYIEKLQRDPDSSIQRRLVISLDASESDDQNLKKIFLDIACCFIAWEKEKVVEILQTYYKYADYYIDILEKRCLLTINSEEELHMHDLLREIGMKIARNNSPEEPGKHSRLWLAEEICDVLRKDKGTEVIEAIMLFIYMDPYKEDPSFATETLRRMSKLRFFCFTGINLIGNFEQTLEDVRWFLWGACPLKCLPLEFYPEKLVILELPGSKMTTMWEQNMVPRAFKKLKILNVSYSDYLTTTPDFAKLLCLETLNLKHCVSLEEIHISIGSLVNLVSLVLESCVNLKSLPDTICNLRALKSLNIKSCCRLKALPEELGNIKSLTEINACGTNVSKLPDSIGCLSKLVKLILDDNNKLKTLPNSICNLRALEYLGLGSCTSLKTLPTELGNIRSLTELNACGINVLKLPDSIGCLSNLVTLSLSNNKKLKTLPDSICNLTALKFLGLNYCTSLEALPTELGNMRSLTRLTACSTNVSKLPDSIGRLSNVVFLQLSKNNNLETLPDTICNLGSLEILDIFGCEKLEILPDQLWKLTRLIHLQADGLTMLKKVPDIEASQIALSLQFLNLSMSLLTALPSGICQLSNLEHLYLRYCNRLLSIAELPPNLKIMSIHGCKSLERLPNISNLKRLEKFYLTNCSGLSEILGIEELTSLSEIHLGVWNSSLPPCALTEQLFQIYSGYGHEVCVYLGKLPDWICQASVSDSTRSFYLKPDNRSEAGFIDRDDFEVKVSFLNLPPNVSLNSEDYLGIIICLEGHKVPFNCSVKSSASIYKFRNSRDMTVGTFYNTCMVLVPSSIFLVTDADTSIDTMSYGARITGIFVLYRPEITMSEEFKFVDPTLQDIFLDIACFFIGWKKEEVVNILETYYTSVNHYVDILKEKCLLATNDEGELVMQDRLQYMGKQMAHNNLSDEPGKYSRLWLSVDIYDVLKKHTGTPAIKGIVRRKLDHTDALEGKSFTTKTFNRMNKLRFLHFKNVNLIGSFERTLEDLRWLCWDECPLECLPHEFYPQKLVILELPHSKLRTMWEPNMVSHVFDNLKTLNMSYSLALTTSPDFTKLPCLETLNFEYCERLKEVHISVGSLVRLFSLNLHDCGKLETLPHTICNLKVLKCLDISGCSSLDALPIELGNMESLRELYAQGLNVQKLPDSIGCLNKLVELRLGCSRNLETLPNTICNLSSLEVLDISGCERLEILPHQLWKLARLKVLDARGLNLLKKLPDIESGQIALSLKILGLSDTSLTSLPAGISQLSALEGLDLRNCGNLFSIAKLPPNLKRINIYGCTSMERLPNLSNLKQLEVLDIRDCNSLMEVVGLEELTSLQQLHLIGCNSSLAAFILTKRLFEIYFGFGHVILIHTQEFPDWISPTTDWRSESESTFLKFPSNVSHNLLGAVLCFQRLKDNEVDRIDCYFKNVTTGFSLGRYIYKYDDGKFGVQSLMVVAPRSICPIKDGDEGILLKSYAADIHGIHLLYKSEYDSTTVNTEI